MVGGKIAGQTAAEFLDGKCALQDYDERWRREMGLEIKTAVYVRKLMDNLMRSDSMMSTAIRMIAPEQMKALQCGQLPDAVRKGLIKMNFGIK